MDVLIVVDMQNDFIDGCLGNNESRLVVSKVKKRIKDFKGAMIFTKDTHDNDYLNTKEGQFLPVPHCIKDSDGYKIPSSIVDEETLIPLHSLASFQDLQDGKSYVIEKVVFGSDLLACGLQSIEEQIDKVYLCGLCTDICVVSNALILRAFLKNSDILVYKDATEATSLQMKQEALDVMAKCNIQIVE